MIYLILISILVFCVLLFIFKNKEEFTAAEVRMQRNEQSIECSLGTTAYKTYGSISNPIIVLVHGAFLSNAVYINLGPHLAKKGFYVICYDNYGKGFSDRTDANTAHFSDYVSQLNDVIDILSPHKKVHLFGYSLGGGIVLDFASQYPDKVESIIAAVPFIETPKLKFVWLAKIPILGSFVIRTIVNDLVMKGSKKLYASHPEKEYLDQSIEQQYTIKGSEAIVKKSLELSYEISIIPKASALKKSGISICIMAALNDELIEYQTIVKMRKAIDNQYNYDFEDSHSLLHSSEQLVFEKIDSFHESYQCKELNE